MYKHKSLLSYVYLYGGIIILALLVIALSLKLSVSSVNLSLWKWGHTAKPVGQTVATKTYSDAARGYSLRYPTSLYLQEKADAGSTYLELSGISQTDIDILVLPQQTEKYLRGHLGLTGTIVASEDYFKTQRSVNYLKSVSVQGRIGYVLVHDGSSPEKIVLFKNANGTWFVLVTALPKASLGTSVEPFDAIVVSLAFSK